MEDDAKENTCPHRKTRSLGKAGWIKKAPCRLLASYKERYIQVENTEMVVYDNEELRNCTERLDLENYDRCQELKSTFKKKHRLILIRSPKSGNKVHNIKLQTQCAEDKEAWIKALSDAINQAKNKVLDEVKVDESSHLEHVTRSRPRANRNRRPPTRIHMKEVAVVSSDGILRLDLDLEDAYMPEGPEQTGVQSNGVTEDTDVSASQSSHKRAETEWMLNGEQPEVSPQLRVIPMPADRKCSPVSAPEDQLKDVGPDREDLKPPPPPAKEAKPQQNTRPPPLPANKPTSTIRPAETVPSSPESLRGQTPNAAIDLEQQCQSIAPRMNNKEPDEGPQKTNKLICETCVTEGAEPQSDSPALRHPVVSLFALSGAEHHVDITTSPVSSSAAPAEQDLLCYERPPVATLLPACRNTRREPVSSDEEGGALVGENISAASTEALRSSAIRDEQLHAPINAHLKPSAKVRSASSGDLLSDASPRQQADSRRVATCGDDVTHLQSEVCVGTEETSEVLCSVSHAEGQKTAEDLLAEAMEKLRAAESVLSKFSTLHLSHDPQRRKSC